MSTRLEELQSAAKAKTSAGQPIFATPAVNTPITSPPTTGTIAPTLPGKTPVAGIGAMAGVNAGIAPVTAPGTSVSPTGSAGVTTTPAPTTNYGGNGSALNEILYSKKQYDAGNKAWAANNAQQYYAQLPTDLASNIRNMNTQQLTDYINGLTAPTGTGTVVGTGATMGTGVPSAPTQSADYSSIMDTIRKSYMADLDAQALSINQALEKAIAASQLNVNQNNNQLQEQIRSLTNQKAQLDDAAQQLQNRRGGFYSGGLDYQLGNIASSTQQATSDAQRDVATRNDAIYANNALLAQQAAQQIQALQTAAPDKIRELIRQAISDQQQLELQQGSLTGNYNGTRTLAGQAQDYSQMADTRNYNYQAGQDTIANNAQYAGTYNGNKTVDQQQREWENQYNQSNNTFNQNVTMAQLTGYLPDGTPTSSQQQQNLANLWTVADQTGTIPDALATMYGLPKGTQTQAAMQFAAQLAISQGNLEVSQGNLVLGQDQQSFNQNKAIIDAEAAAAAAAAKMTPQDYAKSYVTPLAQYNSKGVVTNKNDVIGSIVASGYDDATIDSMFKQYGITDADIKSYRSAYGLGGQ